MINILLSVKRPFSGLILDDKKPVELRKNAPRIPKGEHVTLWLYDSGKDGERAIIGKCKMTAFYPVFGRYSKATEQLFRDTAKDACVSEEQLWNYMPCYVWRVQDPVRLLHAVPLSDIGLTRPPQSWQYITEGQAAIIERESEIPF